MNQSLVDITLHGNVFEGIRQSYKLAVKSVSEAIHAINCLSKQKFYQQLLENDKKGIAYNILINGKKFVSEEPLTTDHPERIKQSDLAINVENLETIDIVPVVEGGDSDIGAIIVGVLLVVIGIAIAGTGVGAVLSPFLIGGGLGLIAAGIINLLSPPPKFEDFREIGGGGKVSYLFSGPTNTTKEGGPVPVGYGRLLVGSHVISASYEITHKTAKSTLTN